MQTIFPDGLYLPLQLDDPIGPAFLVAMVTLMRTDTTGIVYKASLRGVCVCDVKRKVRWGEEEGGIDSLSQNSASKHWARL
jgi:hypothetical protein